MFRISKSLLLLFWTAWGLTGTFILTAQNDTGSQLWPSQIEQAVTSGDSSLLGRSFLNQARIEKARNRIKPSIQNYLEAIPILEKEASKGLYYEALTELAEIYLDQQFLNEAQDYLRQSIQYFSEKEDTSGRLTAHFLLTRVFLKKELLDKAEEQFEQFTELSKTSSDTIQWIRTALMRGLLLEKRYRIPEAIESLYHAYAISKESREPNLYTLAMMELGRLHLAIGEANKAILALSRAEAFNQLSENHEQLKEIYHNLSQAYELDNNYRSAYYYLGKYTQLNDSLLNAKRQEIINRLNIRYEAQQKQMEIISLANDKRLADLKARNDNISLYSMLIGFIGVLVAAYFTILYYQQRLSANQIIAEQMERINKSQINELKNSVELESMKSMIQGQEMERDRIAKDLHDSLGGLLSSIKLKYDSLQYQRNNGQHNTRSDEIHSMLDNAIQEVRVIASNLTPGALQKLGLVKAVEDLISKVSNEKSPVIDFQVYGMDIEIDDFTAVHCYRIIQELLVNSIKHSNASEILVQMTRQNDQISILVEDDGVGYDADTIQKGMGTDNILSRVSMLQGEIHTETNPGKGTSTLIHVPLKSTQIRVNT